MDLLALEFTQVDFLLQVRKAGLEVLSMKQVEHLASIIITTLNPIIKTDFLLQVEVRANGVMISIKR